MKIIVGDKEFFFLQADHNCVDVISGHTMDRQGNTGVDNITYFTGAAAMRETKKQGYFLLSADSNEAVNDVILHSSNIAEDVREFVKKIGLPKTGYYGHPETGCRGLVNAVHTAYMSEMRDDGLVRGIFLQGNLGAIRWSDGSIPQATIVFRYIK